MTHLRRRFDHVDEGLVRRIYDEVSDTFDEELEFELDDRVVDRIAGGDDEGAAADQDSRRRYFR